MTSKSSCRQGMVQTVTGLVPPEGVGPTMMHEHLLIDFGTFYKKPLTDEDQRRCVEDISLANRHWVSYHVNRNLNNVVLDDIETAVEELNLFKQAGGATIVDVTTIGIRLHTAVSHDTSSYRCGTKESYDEANRAHALALREISLKTGLNIVLGAGFYVTATLPSLVTEKMTEVMMEEVMVNEVLNGVPIPGSEGEFVRAGIIGEIGCSSPLTNLERKALRAAARAQRRTGVSVSVHPGRARDCPFEIVDILVEAGADISRVIMGHIDRTLHEAADIKALAERGVVLEFDLFGNETSFYSFNEAGYMPSDEQRLERIKVLLDEGFEKQVVVAHDVYSKHRLHRYGGHGYDHLMVNIVPRMRTRGYSQSSIDAILVNNPARLLALASI